VNLEHAHTQRFNQTRSSAIAEGLHSALVSINLAITKQSTNDLEVYTPKVITFAAFRQVVYHFLLVACSYNVYLAVFTYHF